MNFLAHYMLASKRDSPEYHLGSLFPDFGRRAGIPLLETSFAEKESGPYSELIAGMKLHWFADREFHSSDLFSTGYHLWKTEIAEDISGVHRKFFLYHLLFEMWLDRILMNHNSESATRMYESLERVDGPFIQQFSLEKTEDSENKLLQTLDDFRRRQFILAYEDPGKFAGIAAGVFAHATRQSRSEELRHYLDKKLPDFDRHQELILRKWEEFERDFSKEWQFPH